MPQQPVELRRRFAGAPLGAAPDYYTQLQRRATDILGRQIETPFMPQGIPELSEWRTGGIAPVLQGLYNQPGEVRGIPQLSSWQGGGIAPTLAGLYSQPWPVRGAPELRGPAVGVLQDYLQDPFSAGFFSQRQAQAQQSIGARVAAQRRQLAEQLGITGTGRTPALHEAQQRMIGLEGSRMESEALMQNLLGAEQLRRQAVPEMLGLESEIARRQESSEQRRLQALQQAAGYESEVAGRQENAQQRRLQALQQAAQYDRAVAATQERAAALRNQQMGMALGYEPLQLGQEAFRPIEPNEWLGLAGQVGAPFVEGLGEKIADKIFGGAVDKGIDIALTAGASALGITVGAAVTPALASSLAAGAALSPYVSAAGMGGSAAVGGTTAAAGAATGTAGGVGGAITGLLSNPVTWGVAAGLGLYFGLRGLIGQGRKTSDKIVPTQQQVDESLAELYKGVVEEFDGGQLTPERAAEYAVLVGGIHSSFEEFLQQFGDNPAATQAREDMGAQFIRLKGLATYASLWQETSQRADAGTLTPEELDAAIRQVEGVWSDFTQFAKPAFDRNRPITRQVWSEFEPYYQQTKRELEGLRGQVFFAGQQATTPPPPVAQQAAAPVTRQAAATPPPPAPAAPPSSQLAGLYSAPGYRLPSSNFPPDYAGLWFADTSQPGYAQLSPYTGQPTGPQYDPAMEGYMNAGYVYVPYGYTGAVPDAFSQGIGGVRYLTPEETEAWRNI